MDKNIRVRDGSEIPIRIYSPKEATQGGSPLIVNYHGGGWNMGDLSMCIDFCRSLVTSFKAVVVDVDYRLAPEFPFPTPVNDSWDALLWVSQSMHIWSTRLAELLRAGITKILKTGRTERKVSKGRSHSRISCLGSLSWRKHCLRSEPAGSRREASASSDRFLPLCAASVCS